ncbi:MAG: hypothetical protein QM607_10465 [Microbacterium sp.]
MAALLVKLRWRQYSHQLSRNSWMIVALIFSVLGAAGMVALLAGIIVTLRVEAAGVVAPVLTLIGAVITLGWWGGAILVGVDDLLAPERFALLPVTSRGLLPGAVCASLLGVGGIGTLIALLSLCVGWSVSAAALVSAILLIPLAMLICVLGARVVSGVLARTLAGRRSRDIIAIFGVMLAMFSGIIVNLAISGLGSLDADGSLLLRVADVAGWTPMGVAFGVNAALADGAWLTAVARLVIALVVAAVLWWASSVLLARRLVEPIQAGGGGRVHSGGFLDRMLPVTSSGAIAARSLRYRRRDPRHIINVVSIIAVPAVIVAMPLVTALGAPGPTTFSPALILAPATAALIAGTIAQMDLAYDHDALALHIHSGVRGVDDRAGRLLAISLIVVPAVVAMCLACCALIGDWALLPASLGASLGVTLAAMGAGIWLGVYLPGRAPAPETSPLGRGSSGGLQSMLALIVILPAAIIVGGAGFGLAIAAIWTPTLAWASLAAGLLLGAGTMWLGVMQGGKALDRRWPEVLAAVSSES